jgi:hypothetical protein
MAHFHWPIPIRVMNLICAVGFRSCGQERKEEEGGSPARRFPARAVLEVVDDGAPVGCDSEEVADGV